MKELKQPELGQSILSLRQKKRLTQEELVELCNINVRTLQRIESGEVTPREYTIRTILNALDYDFEQVESSINKKTTLNHLKVGWMAGTVYFVLGLFEFMVDFARFEADLPYYFPFIYTSVKTIAMVSFIYFMIGFVAIGRNFQNSLLKISAYLMAGSMLVMEAFDIVSIFSEITSEEFMGIKGAEAVAFGGIDVIFGIALFKLSDVLGTTSKITGILEILAGACFLTFILAFLGLILLIPANILEVVLLYKCYETLQKK